MNSNYHQDGDQEILPKDLGQEDLFDFAQASHYLAEEEMSLEEYIQQPDTIGFLIVANMAFRNYIKDKPYTYCILGDSKDLDLNNLGHIGKITKLTKEEIFGY